MFTHRKRRGIIRLVIVYSLLFAASLLWYGRQRRGSVQIAVAKAKQLYEVGDVAAVSLQPLAVQEMALADDGVAGMLAGKRFDFVNALPLSLGEARPWQEAGCGQYNCAHVVYYNYSDGGTTNVVVNLNTGEVVGRWQDAQARPGGSPLILDKALDIAASDPFVQATLGEIGAADPAMIPMSGWLVDDACGRQWCVDLTFHDPTGSGRIIHVFVNMEQQRVARTFYTRGRPERSLAAPLPQRNAFSNGCHEQYGWQVCWEMTAHDGVLFRDATYNGQTIFSSAKIGQIEAWYPSWPGGYRDEIGFAATVPPFGGTQVTDFGNSFEVRQLFTEFTFWPNCICCYRYEEVIRFYGDGSLDFRFVSHGPGCDDLSIYRPFWRIDIDLDGPEGDSAWLWQENQWQEVTAESEFHPFVADVFPDGYKLATLDEPENGRGLLYQWQMVRTDPLGLDEGRFFVLRGKEGEGAGPIVTGPGDTFQPPRQWLDGEVVSGENIVLWYVPLLKTKKGGPWWCMPDPEPEFNPCEGILRAVPGDELRQPTAEELAQSTATPTPTPQPTPDSAPAPTSTPRPLEGEDVRTIILNAGCGSCHTIGDLGEEHKVGPDLSGIGLIAGERIPGLTAADYLRQSILEPNAFIAPACPNGACLPNIMPRDYASRLSAEQVETLVSFLLTQQEQPTVVGAASAAAEATPAPKAFPAPKKQSEPPSVSDRSALAVQLLLLSIVFLLSLFRLFKESA